MCRRGHWPWVWAGRFPKEWSAAVSETLAPSTDRLLTSFSFSILSRMRVISVRTSVSVIIDGGAGSTADGLYSPGRNPPSFRQSRFRNLPLRRSLRQVFLPGADVWGFPDRRHFRFPVSPGTTDWMSLTDTTCCRWKKTVPHFRHWRRTITMPSSRS